MFFILFIQFSFYKGHQYQKHVNIDKKNGPPRDPHGDPLQGPQWISLIFQINFDVDSGLIDFAMDASLEVKELLVDNLDDVYKSDLSVTSTGLRVLALAKVAPEVSVAQSVNALRRILDALPSFVKFL